MAILDFVSPGEVIMIACGGNDAAAGIGDLASHRHAASAESQTLMRTNCAVNGDVSRGR
jgi:hypothetical protein